MSVMDLHIIRTAHRPDMIDDEADPAFLCELAEEYDIDISAISPYHSPADMQLARLGRIYRDTWENWP